MPTETELVRSA